MTVVFSIIAVAKLRDDSVRSSEFPSVRSAAALPFSAPLVVGIGFVRDSNPLNQSTRVMIYEYVKDNPGTHLRGLCSALGISVGVAQYHLQFLTKAGLLCSRRYGRYRRYFESGKFDGKAMKTISLLRHGTARRIVSMLLEAQILSHKGLAAKLGISSQALTWQVNRLKGAGLIDCATKGVKTRYLLAEGSAAEVRRYLDLVS